MKRWEFKAWITVQADNVDDARSYAHAIVEKVEESGVLIALEDSEPDEIEDEQEA